MKVTEKVVNKKRVSVCMLHEYTKCAEDIYRLWKLEDIVDWPVELEWDEIEPEYLIATDLIYVDHMYWDKFVKLYSIAKVCIYWSGECIAGDLNIFDYAIVFDKHLCCDDRIIKTPTRLFFSNLIFQKENDLVGKEKCVRKGIKNKKFCNYIYSNGSAHKNRTQIFHLLSEYKKVDSWGRYLHNVDDELKVNPKLGFRPMIKECIEVKSNYKFSIAFENATYDGYTSEKVFSSLEAHTVPIYWGNPLVSEELNPEAFINCHNFDSLEDVLEEVKRIDNDDEAWIKMVCSPWKTKEQEEKEEEEIREYYEFINNIFSQPFDKARRRGEGFHPGRYREWFFQTQSNNNKFQCYHDVEIRWIENLQNGISIEKYFINNHYKTVAIYGMAQLGLRLYDELKKSEEVMVIYGIDQGMPKVPADIKIYKINELPDIESPDVIVVTVPHLYNTIKENLSEVHRGPVVSIRTVLEYAGD